MAKRYDSKAVLKTDKFGEYIVVLGTKVRLDDEPDEWVTINGNPVPIKYGKAIGGNPKALGKDVSTFKCHWSKDFPKATIHTTLKKMKSNPHYQGAKHGSEDEARLLLNDIVKEDRIKELAESHPGAKVVAIHKPNTEGMNFIPLAYAERFENYGLEVDTDLVQCSSVERKSQNGDDRIKRLTQKPMFDGEVEEGREYIIVDDQLTTGGTTNQLRKYIESKGGKVVAISSLSASKGGTYLAVQEKNVKLIRQIFSDKGDIDTILRKAGIAHDVESLTDKEAAQIIQYSSGRKKDGTIVPYPDRFRDRIAKETEEGDA